MTFAAAYLAFGAVLAAVATGVLCAKGTCDRRFAAAFVPAVVLLWGPLAAGLVMEWKKAADDRRKESHA